MFVPQDLLNSLDVNAVLQHERSGGMAELVGGILCAVQTGLAEAFFDQGVDIGAADPLVPRGQEQGVLVRWFDKDRIRDFVRITIGSKEQMEALAERIDQVLDNG